MTTQVQHQQRSGYNMAVNGPVKIGVELNVLGRQAESLVVEVSAKVTNKGLVRHWLSDFRFDLLYLPKDVPIQLGDNRINEQVLFQPVFKRRYWIPPDWISTFIDPGVCQRFTYIASAPADAAFLLVFAIFKYPDAESEFHTAQKVWAVEHSSTANPALHMDAPQAARR